ncbi:DNA pilot protein [Apis mellifera associated microvirus 50]|nr:DNA pilot protein [Apis mellifera associated microvirus 50]
MAVEDPRRVGAGNTVVLPPHSIGADMSFFSSLIPSAINALGSFFGAKESAGATTDANNANVALARELNASNEAMQREFFAKNEALQREFAQMGIRWKVADAEAAGLHPLYALGGSGATYSPTSVVGGAAMPTVQPTGGSGVGAALKEMGQGVARALAAQETAEQRALKVAQLDVLAAQAERDRAQASYYASEAQRLRSNVVTSPLPDVRVAPARALPPPATRMGGGMTDVITAGSRVELKPDEQTMSVPGDASAGAGRHPYWRTHVVSHPVGHRQLRVDLPYSDEGPAEAEESLSWSSWPRVLLHNVKKYGIRWLDEYFLSRTPPPSGATGSWANSSSGKIRR